MRGKRGLGGLACALAAITMLTACYAGIGHMLEEDYNPRFAMPEPLPQVQEPAPPEPQDQQKIEVIRKLNASTTIGDTNIGLRAQGESWKWEVKKKDGSPFTGFNVLDDGTFHLYYPRSGLTSDDTPLKLTCTLTVNGVQHTSHGLLYFFDTSKEWKEFVDMYYE